MRLFKSLSLSYQKKDWRSGPHQSFFWYGTNYQYRLYIHCHMKRRICGALSANPSCGTSGMTTMKIFQNTFLQHRPICQQFSTQTLKTFWDSDSQCYKVGIVWDEGASKGSSFPRNKAHNSNFPSYRQQASFQTRYDFDVTNQVACVSYGCLQRRLNANHCQIEAAVRSKMKIISFSASDCHLIT